MHSRRPFARIATACTLLLAAAVRAAPPADEQLVEAVRVADAAKVTELLKAGADPYQKIDRFSAYERVISESRLDILQAFAAGGVKFDRHARDMNVLELALRTKTTTPDAVRTLIANGAKVDDPDIHIALVANPAALRDPHVLQALLDAGAPVRNDPVSPGWPLLSYAVLHGSPDSIRLLLDHGLSGASTANAINPWVALTYHLPTDEIETIGKLLSDKHVAGVNTPDQNEWTPLHFAAFYSSPVAVRAYVAAGARVNVLAHGRTPLLEAAISGDAATLQALVDLKADVNQVDSDGMSPLMWAIECADPVSHEKWKNAKRDQEPTSLTLSTWENIRRQDPAAKIQILLKAGADPNGAKGEWSALAMAVWLWDEDNLAPYKAANGHNGSNASILIQTQLFYASHDPTTIVKMLVDAGARRQTGAGHIDPIDVAFARTDLARDAILGELRKAKVAEPPLPKKGDAPSF